MKEHSQIPRRKFPEEPTGGSLREVIVIFDEYGNPIGHAGPIGGGIDYPVSGTQKKPKSY